MSKVKINYNDTFGTMHSRDYYRGASFHFSGKWISGAHYISDDYNIDFVVHGQVLLACAKSHLSSLDNEPTEFIKDEGGTIIGVISTYWDFVLSGIVGNSPGVKIIDNYWYICKNTGVPEEEQVWENTGVKAKMELDDLTPEEIVLLQEPGKQVVTEFVNNTITQETGQNIDKIMSQKAVTEALNAKASVSQVTSAIANEVQRAENTYQPKGDYATNTTVNTNKQDADNKFEAVNVRIDTTNENVSNNSDNIQEEIENRESEIERVEVLISAEETARVESDNILFNRISQEATARSTVDNNLEQSIANINAKIPSEASSSNQLADKDFVHNEVSTSTAIFKGTYSTLAELQQQTADNNDYGFVVHTDALGNVIYSRYKYNGTSWLWEYDIASTEFSQSQWDVINSGINSSLVTKLSELPTNANLQSTLDGKVNVVPGKQLSTEDYTTSEKSKLSGIESGAEANVQADWTQSDSSDDSYIKNKPTALKNPESLTFGSKTYDGSTAQTITATDLGALTTHQDISGKADKVTNATNGNFASLNASGNLVDSGKKASDFQAAGNYKTTQTAVSDPAASGTGITFISGLSQDSNGVISPSKKTVQSASSSQDGLMSSSDYTKLSGIASNAQVNVIEAIQINGTAQTITSKTVNLPAYPTTLPASDVYSWAKASTKPSYTLDEVSDGSTRKLSNYKTISSLQSEGNASLPIYFDASGNAQVITDLALNGSLSGNAFKTIAEHIAELTSRVTALENSLDSANNFTANSVDSAEGYYRNGDKTILTGTDAPTVIPNFVGQFYINTSGPALYYSTGNSATTDWKQA